MKRALVLGATGHIGQAMVRELIVRGYTVTATTRRERPASLAGLDVIIARGDADAPGQLDAWVRGNELVVDAAAPCPVNLFQPQSEAERAPLGHAEQRTAALLRAIAEHDARLVFVSSFTTLPRHEDGIAALETFWRHRSHPYFAVKRLMEGRVVEAARRGAKAVIVCPSACLGPWDDKPPHLALVPMLLAGRLPALVRRVANYIDVRDFAAGAFRALEQERYGEAIPLTGHDIAADTLSAQICALGGVEPPRLMGSARLGAATTFWIEAAFAMQGKPSPMPSLAALLVCDAYAMGPPTAMRELGARVRPLEETLRDAIAWYRR